MKPNIARILLKSKSSDPPQSEIPPALLQFDPSVMVDMFPGPALLVDGRMAVQHHNVFAQSLLTPLQNGEAFLTNMVSRCLSNGCPDSQKATLKDPDGLRHYDLYAFPVTAEKTAPPLVFLFGRETTIEHNLTNALVDSRQMFKDLVSCSTDFAWETDQNGNFIYVSPKGILGYTAYELNGKNSGELIIGDDEANPFKTENKIDEMELWLKRADGHMACLLVSAVPVMNSQAAWQGVRGVCRDITRLREREALLRRTRKRDHILGKLIATIRDMTHPSDMLSHALTATMEGIPSDGGCIIQKTPHMGGSFKAEVKQQSGIPVDSDLLYSLCQKALSVWSQTGSDSRSQKNGPIEALPMGDRQILMGITSHHGVDNGVIFLIREKNIALPENSTGNSTGNWHEDETHLFKGITSHLGIALEQALTYEELEKRAFTDELTGLLNRRAFAQEIKKRLKNQQRSRRAGAMLYLDLDNFKNVNDSKGHAHGDMILKQLAKIIGDNIRVGDYAARLGGDEFAIWLDDVTEQNVHAKAHSFITAGARLARLADVAGPPLSLSIGMAIHQPDDDLTFKELMDNADKALYQAKSSGKAAYALYDPNTKKTEQEEGNHA